MKKPTMKVIEDRQDRRDDLIAAGELVNMRFMRGKQALSLRASKMLHLLVKTAGVNLTVNQRHAIDLQDLRDIANLTNQAIMDLFYELQTTLVEVKHKVSVPDAAELWTMDGTGAPTFHDEIYTESGPILALISTPNSMKGKVFFKFSEPLLRVFEKSEHWAILEKRAVMAFSSRYALRLFEIISLRSHLQHVTSEIFLLDDLRARMGVPSDRLTSFGSFKQKALDPATTEVNHLAPFKMSYDTIKNGRLITGINVKWKLKEKKELSAVKKELDNHSTGRKERRENKVEEIVDETQERLVPFPQEGPIEFSVWAMIARQNAPKPVQDLTFIADNFRRWAKVKSMSLESPSIKKAFVTFCSGLPPAS
jgi:hypothetical protein